MADDKKAPPAAEAPVLPAAIQLQHPFGYIDEARRTRTWLAGEVVRDRVEVALLHTRGASFVVVAE